MCIGQEKFNFLSVYCRPSKSITSAIEPITQFSTSFFKRTVAAFDSNAHSRLWGSKTADLRGENFESFILKYGLNIKNSRTSETPSQTIMVDVTLTGDYAKCSNWRYLADDSLSDHPLIIFFKIVTSDSSRVVKRRIGVPKWKHVFETAYLSLLSSKIEWLQGYKMQSKEEIDIVIDRRTMAVTSSAKQNSQDSPPIKQNDVDWWKPYLYGLRHYY